MPRPDPSRSAPATRPGSRLVVSRWVWLVSLVLVVLGLAVASYLTVEHYTSSTTLACPENGIINCQKVTTSEQSGVFGIPVAVLGLAYFALMVPACLPVAWRSGHPLPRLGRVIMAAVGIGFVFYLLYTELFVLDAICLWCTAVHVITVLLFAVVVIGTASADPVGDAPLGRAQGPRADIGARSRS